MADFCDEMLAGRIAETGRPVHPSLAPWVEPGEVDPTARPFRKPNGEVISARERTMQSAISHHALESLTATLTPLGMIATLDALLGFLSPTNEELEHGYHGIPVDPWGEVAQLPADVREEIGRAGWHTSWALEALAQGRPVEEIRDEQAAQA